jgi:hypothetical protein
MAKYIHQPAPLAKSATNENAKIARLRELRLANDAARREAGTFGDISLIEILHEPSGDVFVLYRKGGMVPDLARLQRSRTPGMSQAEHERLQAWLSQYEVPTLKQAHLGWNLSLVEAKRAKQARIDAQKTAGHRVVNDAPIAQAG